jgi:hypothetical protein
MAVTDQLERQRLGVRMVELIERNRSGPALSEPPALSIASATCSAVRAPAPLVKRPATISARPSLPPGSAIGRREAERQRHDRLLVAFHLSSATVGSTDS